MNFTLSTGAVIDTADVQMTLLDKVNGNFAVIFKKVDSNGDPTFIQCDLQDCMDLLKLHQIRHEVR